MIFTLFLIFCGLITHTKTHTQTMAHCHHHPPLSSHSTSSHVLCAIPLVAAVDCPPPSLPRPLSVLMPLVAIALFITVTIALAALAIPLFVARHPSCCRNCNLHRQRSLCCPPHSLLLQLPSLLPLPSLA